MEKIKNEITLRLVANDLGILVRNGSDLICPFVPPLQFRQIKQNSALIGGQPQEDIGIQKSACNTGCPLMQINDDGTLDVCCGGQKVTHKLNKIITIEEQMGKKQQQQMGLKIEKGGGTVN